MSSPGRPIGNFLFLGPTGSGKTRMVEATAESLVGDMRAVIKIDCAEFQHSHEIAKLIGSPPGYLGHRETHPLLSQEVLKQYHTDKMKLSFVLFDEIEKASDALWNLLLGILDKATLTLGDNRRVDFSRAMIFMTSNLGAARDEFDPASQFGICGFRNGTQVFRGLGGWDSHRENLARRRGSGAAEVYAGVHEPHRQGGGVPAAGRTGTAQDSGSGAEHPAAADFQFGEWRAVRVLADRSGQGFSAARRHRHEVRRAASEAGHRSQPGASAVQPDRHRAGARRRSDQGGLRWRTAAHDVFQGSGRHAALCHDADDGSAGDAPSHGTFATGREPSLRGPRTPSPRAGRQVPSGRAANCRRRSPACSRRLLQFGCECLFQPKGEICA